MDKTNWIGKEDYKDTFSLTQNGNIITVKRTDKDGGWGQRLEFKCCVTGMYIICLLSQLLEKVYYKHS